MNKFFRKAVIVFLCVSLAFIFSSCEKKGENKESNVVNNENSTTTANNQSKESGEDNQEEELDIEPVEGVIYAHQASIYTETDEGKMKWAGETALGDIATYLGEKKKAKRTDNKERTFFHIMLNEKEYWIQDYCYEPNTVLAFISGNNTVIYKSESLTAATDEFIPKYFMVAVYKDSLNSSNKKFVKIAAYCPELYRSWVVKEKFVKRDFVELGTNNVEAMVLAQIAMDSDNETIREELFQNAIEIDTKYSEEIAELQNLAKVKDDEAKFLKNLETEKINKKLIVLNDSSLYSIPNETQARENAIVKEDDILNASRMISFDEDGVDVTWFYVQIKQKKGWIKNSFVKEK